MSLDNLSARPKQSYPTSTKLIKNTNDDDQVHVSFLQQQQHHQQQLKLKRASLNAAITNNALFPTEVKDRTPSNLLELKRQRLLAAADRKNRIITRIVSIVGLLIILLCAAIVTFTLKMAPKIDELVRTKSGSHQLVQLMSRMTTPFTAMTIESNNFTSNSSPLSNFPFRTR